MRPPRGAREVVLFAALVLSGYVAARGLGIGEPLAFILTAAIALGGWAAVSRRIGPRA